MKENIATLVGKLTEQTKVPDTPVQNTVQNRTEISEEEEKTLNDSSRTIFHICATPKKAQKNKANYDSK